MYRRLQNEGTTCTDIRSTIPNCDMWSGATCATCKNGYVGSDCSPGKTYNGTTAYKVGDTNLYASNPNERATWANAKTSCPSGMRLPTKDELVTLYNNSWTGKPSSSGFWSSTEYDTDIAYYVYFSGGYVYANDATYKDYSYGVFCVGN